MARYPKFTDRELSLLDGVMGDEPPTTSLERELYQIIHKLFDSNGAAILWAHRWKKCAELLRSAAKKSQIPMPKLVDVERAEKALVAKELRFALAEKEEEIVVPLLPIKDLPGSFHDLNTGGVIVFVDESWTQEERWQSAERAINLVRSREAMMAGVRWSDAPHGPRRCRSARRP